MDTDPRLFCPPDVLRLCTVGRVWNDAKLYGDFAALWFFLMTNKDETPATQLPECPSLKFDYRDNFGFCPQGHGVRRVARLECLRMCRETDLIRNGGAQSKMHPSSHN